VFHILLYYRRDMIKCVSYICLTIAVCFVLSSCGKSDLTAKAKRNSQWIVNHLYSDSVYASLPERYFPEKATHDLINNFRNRYEGKPLKGGFKQQKYQLNLLKNDEALFIYEYIYGTAAVEIRVGYILTKDTFEVAGLQISYYQHS
jgi:hypothetical protein